MLKKYLDNKGELGDWAGRNTIKAPHWGWKRRQDLCHVLRTGHTDIYSFFPAFRAPSFLYIHTNIHHIIPTAPSGLDNLILIGKL
jgi:hypothetical protein